MLRGLWIALTLCACGDAGVTPQGVADTDAPVSDVTPDVSAGDVTSDASGALDGEGTEVLDAAGDGEGDVVVGLDDVGSDVSLDVPDVASEPLAPTWWQCRRALVTDALTEGMEAECDARHLVPPTVRRYGLRLVVLDTEVDLDGWFGPRLGALNQLFEPAAMSFEVTSVVMITGSSIEDLGLDPPRTFEALTTDTAQHLGIDEADPQAVFEALASRLAAQGVASGALDNLTLQTALPVRKYLGTMARAFPEEIHVVLATAINGQQTGGLSSGPGYNPTSASVPTVMLRTGAEVNLVVLAHEMGHYFGLKHPHAQVDHAADEVAYDFDEAVQSPPIDLDVLEALTDHLGEDLGDPLGEPYPPWNASHDPTLKTFDATRAAVTMFWLRAGQVYQMSTDGPAPLLDLADFYGAGQVGKAMYYKNFGWPGGTNCGWDTELGLFSCTLPMPDEAQSVTIPGDDPLLDGTLTLSGGQVANVMTYMSKTLPEGDPLEHNAFVPAAIEVLHLTANAPVRLLLRNLAL